MSRWQAVARRVAGLEECPVRIGIASDHAGFRLKEALKPHISDLGHDVRDFGAASEDPIDYPDTGREVALRVGAGELDRGILVCGTGMGMCIVANKVPRVRAVACSDPEVARLTRRHNDANVLTLGARFISMERAVEVVRAWLTTEFEGGRHAKRLEKIAALERQCCTGTRQRPGVCET